MALIISMAPCGFILQSENRPRVSPETVKSNLLNEQGYLYCEQARAIFLSNHFQL